MLVAVRLNRAKAIDRHAVEDGEGESRRSVDLEKACNPFRYALFDDQLRALKP
jgi:hypothetical protein